MKEIHNNDLEQYGIWPLHHIMDNGEFRFRLNSADGSAYIRTESSSEGAWQNSHSHETMKELYLIQKGWVLFVQRIDDNIVIERYGPEGIFISQPGIPHNVYVAGNTVFHTIKYGDCTKSDWNACPELDEKIAQINIGDYKDEILC